MTDKIVKGMLREYYRAGVSAKDAGDFEEAMRAALLWLADNVSEEMAKMVCDEGADEYWKGRIAAALRKAAG